MMLLIIGYVSGVACTVGLILLGLKFDVFRDDAYDENEACMTGKCKGECGT